MANAPTAGLGPEVAKRLDDLVSQMLPSLGYQLLLEDVRNENEWWYVPIRFTGGTPRDYLSYDVLAEIEDMVMAEHGIHVLLVPAI
jgi:hypothetical protein